MKPELIFPWGVWVQCSGEHCKIFTTSEQIVNRIQHNVHYFTDL